ncbi:MAG TPA: GNAT family N-acetyltransferase [Streptosporangiaceae bacterium]|nr:GNAT family N-acetyltransferase [Streptosporangiaceae bacterium]
MSDVVVRPAGEADVTVIAAITTATGQHDEWGGANPAYVHHLLEHGRVVVAELGGGVVGFGAVQQIGTGAGAVSMLCDLYVDPAVHGRGSGRAMLTDLWSTAGRRMTFSSLHSNAMPLYTSFGLDPWWPLLYLKGFTARLPVINDWTVESATPDAAAACELAWTGADRAAEHRAWAGRPAGESILISRDAGDEVIAAAAVMNRGPDRGIVHLATAPEVDDGVAAGVVLQSLAQLAGEPGQLAHVCLPAPHPAVRALLAAGWRFDEFDLFMASEPDVLDPRRVVPSAGQA